MEGRAETWSLSEEELDSESDSASQDSAIGSFCFGFDVGVDEAGSLVLRDRLFRAEGRSRSCQHE